jgi:hypothetical protein
MPEAEKTQKKNFYFILASYEEMKTSWVSIKIKNM